MKLLIGIALALLVGCTAEEITHCSEGCMRSGARMRSYHPQLGCVCDTSTADGGTPK